MTREEAKSWIIDHWGNDLEDGTKQSEVVKICLSALSKEKGEWIDCGCVYGVGKTSFRRYKCSVCHEKVYEQPMNIKYHKFCLHCGARMRRGKAK